MGNNKLNSEKENGFSIYHDIVINSKKEVVFNAITQPHHLNNWWSLKSSGQPKLDTEYNFYFTDDYNWYGKVIKSEANKSFHIKMTNADEDWTPTTFGFDLEEQENGILIHFFHINWPIRNHHFKRSSFCWALLLNGLKNYIEKGIVIPFEERE